MCVVIRVYEIIAVHKRTKLLGFGYGIECGPIMDSFLGSGTLIHNVLLVVNTKAS